MSDRLTQTRRVGEEDRRVFSLNQSVSTRKARGRRVCLSESESFRLDLDTWPALVFVCMRVNLPPRLSQIPRPSARAFLGRCAGVQGVQGKDLHRYRHREVHRIHHRRPAHCLDS